MPSGRRLQDTNQLDKAMLEYAVAEGLYQSDFLAEDIYDDGRTHREKRIRTFYLDIVLTG